MIPAATLGRLHQIWRANPALSAATICRRLGNEGHRIAEPTAALYRPYPPLLRSLLDPEPTRAVLRARAAELGFVAFDGPSLPYGSVIAIVRASRKRGYAISRARIEYAWEHGVRDLAVWPLCEPFLLGGVL